MDTLLNACMGFGLAAGAGGRACLALLALGVFHHTGSFELSPQFSWIATPPVMAVLGVIALVEILADAHPDLGELADLAAWLPKMVAGFLAFAATTGEVDSSLLALGASGVLGAGTAGVTHFLRTKVRAMARNLGESTHPGVNKAYSYGETGATCVVSGTAMLVPLAVPVVLLGLAIGGFLFWRKTSRRRVDCVYSDCSGRIRPGAVVCSRCKRTQDQQNAGQVAGGATGTAPLTSDPG